MCFYLENSSLKDRNDFLIELKLMKKLEPHPHVAQLLGCCTVTGIVQDLQARLFRSRLILG
jgi:hypothetical protein